MNTTAIIATALLLSPPDPASAQAAEPGSAFEQRCERQLRPRLAVTSREAGVLVSNAVSSGRLNNRGSFNYAGQLMLGMTSSTTRAEYELAGAVLQDPAGGRECLAPGVSVELSLDPMHVFVAREFHPLSCPYRQVVAHEMRHVQLYRDQLPKIEALVRAELARRYAERPLYAPVGQSLNVLQDEIDGWLQPFLKAELDKVELLQVAMDSPEESHRLSHSCQGELAARLGSDR